MKLPTPPQITLAVLSIAAVIFAGMNSARADIVHLDDVIIDGSACIGFDCVNGESFGFDTLRLKENNLRINFTDTSSTASFPDRDWTILVNDSSNGGLERFSIQDVSAGRIPVTVEGNAPSNSLYVDDGGRLGLGTATPVSDVHIKSGNTPTVRLEQDGSSGFTPHTWDVAGNETNFFIRDATSGSTLPFRLFPGAPTSALTIEGSTGDIGLGTTSPDAALDLEANGPGFRLTNTGTGGGFWDFFTNGNTGHFSIGKLGANIPMRMHSASNDKLIGIGFDTGGGASSNTVSIGLDAVDAVLDVQGSIVVDGTTEHADFVFAEDFDLESIEEHAAFMWENKHLPSLPKAPEGLKGPVDLVGHQMGVLAELEKAHIYIERLQKTIKDLEARVEKLDAAK